MVQVFDVDLPLAARSTTEGEYLVLQKIPVEAITLVEEILDQSTAPPRNSGHKPARNSSTGAPAPVLMMGTYPVVSPSLPSTPTFQLDGYLITSPSMPYTPSYERSLQLLTFTSPKPRPVQ